MSSLLADLKHGLRLHLATPLSSGLAVLVLAIAMAFLTAFLSLWNDLALRGHPGFEQPGQLVSVHLQTPERIARIRPDLLRDIAENSVNLTSLTGITHSNVDWQRDSEIESLTAELVTKGYFDQLKPRMQLGRGFTVDEHTEDSEAVVVISYELWQRQFNGQENIIGQSMNLLNSSGTILISSEAQDEDNGTPFIGSTRIVGVMARSMRGTFDDSSQIWLAAERAIPVLYSHFAHMDLNNFVQYLVAARLTSDSNLTAAKLELLSRYANGFPDEFAVPKPSEFLVVSGLVSNPEAHQESVEQVQIFLIAGLLVVLVAGINISLFLLSRTPGRVRELGIRMAVGATLRRLIQQLITESSLLVLAATLLGLLLSVWTMSTLQSLPFLGDAAWQDTSPLNWRVLAMMSVISIVIVALVSLAPIASVKKAGISGSARKMSSRAGWVQYIGGSVQIAVALVMSAVTLALAWHLIQINSKEIGFNHESVFVIEPRMGNSFSMSVTNDQTIIERNRKRQALLSIPAIEQVAFGVPVPNDRLPLLTGSELRPDNRDAFNALIISAGHEYLTLLETPLLRGQLPQAGDPMGAVINRALAEAYFGEVDVVGRMLPPLFTLGMTDDFPIIAVVEDMAFDHPSDAPKPMIFWPESPFAFLDRIMIKSSSSISQLRTDIEELIDQGALEFELQNLYRLEDRAREATAPERTRFYLTLAAAVVVVLLALFGFYGIQRYLIAVGQREYAIRTALGAGPKAIKGMIFLRGLQIAAPGIVFGALIAFIVLARLQDSTLIEQTPMLWLVLIVSCALALLTLLATAGPANRAARGQPSALLRED